MEVFGKGEGWRARISMREGRQDERSWPTGSQMEANEAQIGFRMRDETREKSGGLSPAAASMRKQMGRWLGTDK